MSGKPTIPELVPLIKRHYAKPGNTLGGAFHIILEDGNNEQHHAEWCLERAIEEGDPEAIELGHLLCAASPTQRKKLYSGPYDFYPPMVYWKDLNGVIVGFAGYVGNDGELFGGGRPHYRDAVMVTLYDGNPYPAPAPQRGTE